VRKYGDGTLSGLRTHLNRHVYTLIVFGYTMVVRYFLSFSYLGILLLALLTPGTPPPPQNHILHSSFFILLLPCVNPKMFCMS
jgi:hypothetical protein